MEEPIKRVLNMLYEGKISAEEAERLIRAIKEALSEEEKTKENNKKSYTLGATLREVFSTISETIGESIEGAIQLSKNFKNYGDFQIDGKKLVRVNLLGGTLDLTTYSGSEIKGNFKGGYSVGENSVSLWTTDNARLEVPENIDLEISSLGGNADISGNFGSLIVSTKGGSLKLDADFSELYGKIMGGTSHLLIPKAPLKIKIKQYGGNVLLPKELYQSGGYYVYGEIDHKYIELNLFGGHFSLSFKEA